MQTFLYGPLEEPASREEFAGQIEVVSQAAGAKKFLVARLHGPGYTEVGQLVHNAGDAESRLGSSRHWSVDRMLEEMRSTRLPKLFGPASSPGLQVEGYEFGVAAVARQQNGACVVFLGTAREIATDDEACTLMAAAYSCAEHGLRWLKGKVPRECPFTKQELACLIAYTGSSSSKETSAALGISVKTVENHLERVRLKCGVDSTLAASVIALREEWISWPEVRASAAGD